MAVPNTLLISTAPGHTAWVIVPGDLARLDLLPQPAIDCTGTYLEIYARLPDGTDIFDPADISVEFIDIDEGSARADISIGGTQSLSELVTQDARQATAGWYRIAIVDDDTTVTQRRTLAHGPLIVQYSPDVEDPV
jgi:hypothetical protein